MKRLLLCLTALLLTFTAFAQVPANDLIENAIEITGPNFTDSNVRLDLATTTGENNPACPTNAFTKVYYKYTAAADANLTGIISDVISTPITQSFIIVYTAPDLNQTDVSQLVLVSNCSIAESTSVSVSSGQSYYIEVHRSDLNALSNITFSIATPPANDTIENAIEITGSEYFVEDPLRLDLAAVNPGGQTGGCNLAGLKTVFYKFTANTNGSAFFRLSNSGFNAPPVTDTAYLVAYTAPSLNALNTELSLASSCSIGTQTTFNIVEGQVYYVLINRDEPGAPSLIDARIDQDGTPEERQALIDLYNAADGPNWPLGANATWNNPAPLSTWTNVSVDNGHVVSVVLGTFGITGTLPASLADLTFLETADFRNCNLSGEVPDLSSITTLEKFDISSNRFSFGDLETHFTNNSTIPDFRYTSQITVDNEIQFEPTIGSNYTLSVTPDTGTNVNYQWFRDRGVEDDILIAGATSATYDLINIQSDDLDSYICEITSSTIPDLTIERKLINLTGPVSQQERDALIAFYNATDGPNWTNSTNWLSTEPVGNWDFITTRGNKVIQINIFGNAGLNGVLPTEIGDLIHLEVLNIAIETGLTGPIPASIGNLSELRRFRFQLVGISGSVPTSISNLINLKEIRIFGTNLSGELLSSLVTLTNLEDLTIDGADYSGFSNIFTGQMPTAFGNLINLKNLSLARSSFDGQIPSSFSNLTELSSINLFGCDFSGPLPDLTGFANPESLSIFLDNNFFDFSDLEPLVNNGVEYSFLSYSPQRTLDNEEEITSPPGVDIVLDVNDTNIDRNGEDTAMDNEYQWFKDDVAISGANASTYTIVNSQPTDSGIYYCEITNPLLPDLTIVRANITVTVEDNLGIEDFENGEFKLFPNPAADWISIQTKSGTDAKAQVFDVNGKLLFERQLSAEITAIAIDQLAAGMYLISVTADNMKSTKRFIKQ
jgi:hypothetical protein